MIFSNLFFFILDYSNTIKSIAIIIPFFIFFLFFLFALDFVRLTLHFFVLF